MKDDEYEFAMVVARVGGLERIMCADAPLVKYRGLLVEERDYFANNKQTLL